jgi:hypothetical protein
MRQALTEPTARGASHRTPDATSGAEPPAREAAPPRPPDKRNADGNTRLTGMSASFVLPLFLIEVATVVLGVKSVITLHVAVGLLLLGPVLLKLASVTYRMVSYHRGVNEYRQRGKPAVAPRLLGGALAVLVVLLLASGLVLILGPNAAHGAARAIHIVTAYLVVLLLIVHIASHFRTAARLASADIRRRAAPAPGARSRWLALLASLAIGGTLALLLGGRGSTYLHHYYPSYPAQRSSTSVHTAVADRGATPRLAVPGEQRGQAQRFAPTVGSALPSVAAHF